MVSDYDVIPHDHSKQATLHTALSRTAGSPQAATLAALALHQVLGSPRGQDYGPHAIAGSPIPLNSQHQPPTGRQRPAPGTSQVCP